MKSLGFKQLKQLQEFGRALQTAMIQQDYNLSEVVDILKKLDEERLKSFALMFMEDCFEIWKNGKLRSLFLG